MKKQFYIYIIMILCFCDVKAQQFNTDNHLTMALGTANACITYGQRSATILPSFGLIKNMEFFVGATLVHKDVDNQIEDHFSTIINAKWMFYNNEDSSSGASVTFGTGANPSYHSSIGPVDSFTTFFAYGDYTFTLFDKAISWDFNPGVQLLYNDKNILDEYSWSFTYSTRVAVYKIIPKTAIVGEVYGAAGESPSNMEYKFGLRYEASSNVVPAITFGNTTDNSRGPGFEIGVIIISPQFLFKKEKEDGANI